MSRAVLRAALLLTVFAAACGPRVSGDKPDAPEGVEIPLVSITVEPVDQSLVIDGDTPATSTFRAIGTYDDGSKADISNDVAWSLADITLGTFNGPAFTSTTTHGGRTRVIAARAGVFGETGLELRLRKRLRDPGAPTLPTDPAGAFGGPSDPSRAPDVVYPNDGVLLPPNLGVLEVHFRPGANNQLFEIAFTNSLTDVVVYTRCTVPVNGGCIYTPDAQVWQWIADTNRGGESVTLRTRGTDDNGTAVGTSTETSIAFAFENIKGGIYYWRASGQSAVMRYDFGDTQQTAATAFVGPAQAGGKCVGCHALSRDGKKLFASAGGWDAEDMLLVDVSTGTRTATPPQAAFASWNPTGTKYVGVFAYGATPTHNLMLFDGTTGARTGTIDVGATAAQSTSHPDWSADGTRITYVRAGQASEEGVNNQRFYSGSIHMVSDQGGGTFGGDITVVPAATGKNRYYPSFSPDGALLAFNESTCPSGPPHIHCNADSDPTATVFIAKPEANATPIALTKANAPGKTDAGNTALTNSWPKWAPFDFQRTQDPASRVLWMTFSSTRNFGLRTPPAGTSPESAKGTLLWMVAIDPDQAALGIDPSYPAFYLPFQDVASSNHIAQWTEEIVVLQ